MGKIPDRWMPYSALGKRIQGTRFICFKVPLQESLLTSICMADKFSPDVLMKLCPEIGIVIDLTNTTRFYNPQDFLKRGVEYEKLVCPGQVIPAQETVERFFLTVDSFLMRHRDDDQLIGVHCTHGVNRTGYFVCRYMMQVMNFSHRLATESFERARGHKMERLNYVMDMRRFERGAENSGGRRHRGNSRSRSKERHSIVPALKRGYPLEEPDFHKGFRNPEVEKLKMREKRFSDSKTKDGRTYDRREGFPDRKPDYRSSDRRFAGGNKEDPRGGFGGWGEGPPRAPEFGARSEAPAFRPGSRSPSPRREKKYPEPPTWESLGRKARMEEEMLRLARYPPQKKPSPDPLEYGVRRADAFAEARPPWHEFGRPSFAAPHDFPVFPDAGKPYGENRRDSLSPRDIASDRSDWAEPYRPRMSKDEAPKNVRPGKEFGRNRSPSPAGHVSRSRPFDDHHHAPPLIRDHFLYPNSPRKMQPPSRPEEAPYGRGRHGRGEGGDASPPRRSPFADRGPHKYASAPLVTDRKPFGVPPFGEEPRRSSPKKRERRERGFDDVKDRGRISVFDDRKGRCGSPLFEEDKHRPKVDVFRPEKRYFEMPLSDRSKRFGEAKETFRAGEPRRLSSSKYGDRKDKARGPSPVFRTGMWDGPCFPADTKRYDEPFFKKHEYPSNDPGSSFDRDLPHKRLKREHSPIVFDNGYDGRSGMSRERRRSGRSPPRRASPWLKPGELTSEEFFRPTKAPSYRPDAAQPCDDVDCRDIINQKRSYRPDCSGYARREEPGDGFGGDSRRRGGRAPSPAPGASPSPPPPPPRYAPPQGGGPKRGFKERPVTARLGPPPPPGPGAKRLGPRGRRGSVDLRHK